MELRWNLPEASSVAALFGQSLNRRRVCDSGELIEGYYITVQGVDQKTIML